MSHVESRRKALSTSGSASGNGIVAIEKFAGDEGGNDTLSATGALTDTGYAINIAASEDDVLDITATLVYVQTAGVTGWAIGIDGVSIHPATNGVLSESLGGNQPVILADVHTVTADEINAGEVTVSIMEFKFGGGATDPVVYNNGTDGTPIITVINLGPVV